MKTRVLNIISDTNIGGAGRVLINYAKYYDRKNFDMLVAMPKGSLLKEPLSSLGVTGVRSEITTDIGAMVKLVREANPNIPCAIGFGISTPEQAAKMAKEADGVIVGSAIVNRVAEYALEAAPVVYEYVKSMKDAIR